MLVVSPSSVATSPPALRNFPRICLYDLLGWRRRRVQSCQVELIEFLESFPVSPKVDAIQWGGGGVVAQNCSVFCKSRRDSVGGGGGGVVAEFLSAFSETRPHSVGGEGVVTYIFRYLQLRNHIFTPVIFLGRDTPSVFLPFHLVYILPPYFCRSIYCTSSPRISAVPSSVHPPSIFLPFHLLYILPPYFCRSIYCTCSLRFSAVPSSVHPPSVFLPFHLLYILPPYFSRSI